MLEWLRIPPPPLPVGAALMLLGLATALAGLALLLWGRRLWRALAAILGGGLGVALASAITIVPSAEDRRLGYMLVLGVIGLALGALLARLVWAGLLAATLGLVGLAVLLKVGLETGAAEWAVEPAEDMLTWAVRAGVALAGWVGWAWQTHIGVAGAGGVLIVLLSLLLGLVRPVFTRIVLSSALGSWALVGGSYWLAEGLLGGRLAPSPVARLALVALGVVLAGGGIAWQYRGEIRRIRREEAEATPQDNSAQKPKPSKA